VAFAQVEDNPVLDDFALLLLEHAPSHALAAIRRCLRMPDEVAQRTVTSALAALDQPWCHRELFRALNEANVFEGTAALRAALRRSSAPRGAEVVVQWEKTHPQLRPPVDDLLSATWGEMLESRARQLLEREMEELRSWAEAVRPAIDPDFDRVAWA
jgi:hypothetical protein